VYTGVLLRINRVICCDVISLDDRVADWPLMSAYWPTFALTAAYLIIVYVGPKLMNSRPPFEFRWTLFLYNAGLVALNLHICSEVSLTNVLYRMI